MKRRIQSTLDNYLFCKKQKTQETRSSVSLGTGQHTQQAMQEELTALLVERRSAEANADRLKKACVKLQKTMRDLELSEANIRAVSVPWAVFQKAALHSRKIWRAVDLTDSDAFELRGACQSDDCWYRNNIEEIYFLELWELSMVHGCSLVLCDKCFNEEDQDWILENHPLRNAKTVRVDPQGYEEDIGLFLTDVANGVITPDDIWKVKLNNYQKK
jgi:hypothetical protein